MVKKSSALAKSIELFQAASIEMQKVIDEYTELLAFKEKYGPVVAQFEKATSPPVYVAEKKERKPRKGSKKSDDSTAEQPGQEQSDNQTNKS